MEIFDVGIIILNYNCSKETLNCKKLIEESIHNINYKIFIVDNLSKEDEREILSNSHIGYNTEIIYGEKNGGYSYGNNLGINRAIQCGCKNILVVNPDVIVIGNTIECMNEALNSFTNLVMVGPKVLNSDGNVDAFAQRFIPHSLRMCLMLKYPFSKLNIGNTVSRYFNYGRDFNNTEIIHTTSGCCVMFKNTYFSEFGMFDEEFFMFSEEVVWGKNIYDSKKYFAQYVGSAEIIHNHHRNRMKTKPYVLENKMLSDITFCRKYLGCNKKQMLLLIWYYRLAYNAFSLCSSEYRKNRNVFLRRMRTCLAKFN